MRDEPDNTEQTDDSPLEHIGRVSEYLSSRRSFMNTAATAGGGALTLSAIGGTAAAEGHNDGDNGDGNGDGGGDGNGGGNEDADDVDILNYALSLEHLEAAYYNDFLDDHSEHDVENSAVAKYFARPTLRYSLYQQIQDVRDHEEAHVDALTGAINDLGGTPVEPAEYDFPYDGIEEFVALADRLESVGVSAYAGAIPLLDNPDLLPPALSIHSVEANHSTFFNVLHLQRAAPNAFNPARTMDQVLGIAKQFIVGENGNAPGAVFVMTNDPEKNEVVAFSRADDGTLTEAGRFDTMGKGSGGFEDTDNGLILGSARGESAPNNLIDDTDLLFATNPASNTISVFQVNGTHLELVDVQDSMGEKPVSVTVNDGLLYVLNSGETDDSFNPPNCTTGKKPMLAGFDVSHDGQLTPIPDSTRPLSGDSDSGCAQVSFTPDGTKLVATERRAKTEGQVDSDIELLDEEGVINVYDVNDDGTVSNHVVNAPTGQGPFGFTFTKEEDGAELLMTEQFDGPANPGQGTATSYVVNDDGTLEPRSGSVNNGGTDTCWIVATDDAKYAYTTSFFAEGRISTYGVADDGQLTLLEGEEAFIGQGASDVSLSRDSRYFYARNSFDGTVTGFRVEDDGSLTELQTISDSAASDTAGRIGLAAY